MKTALALALLLGAVQPVDLQRSHVTVYVYKQGLFAMFADNHTIDAPIARGTFDAERKFMRITVDASKMRVLDPRMDPGRRAQVQANMLGQVLDVQHYPVIEFVSTSIDGSGKGRWTVHGNLTLHGQTHPLTFPVQSDGSGHFTGSATVRQTDYGITPIKIAGGTVSVRNDVRVDFDLTLTQ
jgi:polyisoprenoid-binding protein YceI